MAETTIEVTPSTADDILPSVEVRYTDLYYSIMQKEQQVKEHVPNVPKAILSVVLFPIAVPLQLYFQCRQRKLEKSNPRHPSSTSHPSINLNESIRNNEEFVILNRVSGVIRPSTLTLLLAPPGHGKSAYLKALSQRLPPKALKGSITYSGVPSHDASKHGVYIGQLVQYVSQLDEHLPYLTVQETYSFVHANACVDESQYNVDPALCGGVPNNQRVNDMINMLGMSNCENTVIGDALLRGISGGEKKRVTVGEGLLTNARVLCLDEPSTGLDSAVTFTIIDSLRLRAKRNGLAVVISLLQPTPEVYNLFDEVILLREGAVVYHGPRTALPDYLTNLGYIPPTITGPSSPTATTFLPSVDIADYLVEFLTDPLRLWNKATAAKTNPVTATVAMPPITTAMLAEAWKNSRLFDHQMKDKSSSLPLSLIHPFAKRQYSKNYSHALFHHVRLLILRQFRLIRRNRLYIQSRLSSSVFMSIVLGGLYYQRTMDQALTFFGLFLNANMIMGFSNLTEMSTVVESKFIAQKHVANGTFPPFAYVLAGLFAHLPIALVETLIFTSILYFMAGMAPSVGNYFFFYLVVLLTNIFFRNLMATFSYIGKSLQAAQTMPLPIMALLIVFGGFLITEDKMDFLQFMSYLNIFSYALRSMAHNEYFHERYNVRLQGPNGPTLGELYVKAFGYSTERYWQWTGIGFQLGCIAFVISIAFYAFITMKFDRNIGSARVKLNPRSSDDEGNTASLAPPTSTLTVCGTESSIDLSSVLPFEKMTIVFQDITYTVKLSPQLGGGEKTLLRGVSGYALPGRMIALMGASGAGKTTLLDVLGGRKNSGTMTGTIQLNGHPKENASFNRITAYVEQTDIHAPLTTVRESLQFSADLRLPSSVTRTQRHAFVDQVLELLEVHSIADRLVGEPGSANGLAPGERKRLTIGVELVSNAPVIFLDEPTSGLDSRAAAIVMRVIRRITSMGRTVICTIHQPSAELFFMFDDLLLLQRGGYQVYFGPIGEQGSTMIRYLESIPGMPKCPSHFNPASWMLDALAGTDSSNRGETTNTKVNETKITPDTNGTFTITNPVTKLPTNTVTNGPVLEGKPLQDFLRASEVWQTTLPLLQRYANPTPASLPERFASRYPVHLFRQTWILIQRTWSTYMRNMELNFGRFISLTIIGVIFGIVFQGIYDQAYDQSGVQSLVSAIFTGIVFPANLMMNLSVPSIMAGRSIFYREQASSMYNSVAYNLALIIVEIPWIIGITLVTLPVSYFLYALKNTAENFFFHWLVQFILAFVLVSLGQLLAFATPTFEAAQSLLGVLGALFFLFGGLWSPPSGMVPGARWFLYVNPIFFAFRAVVPPQIYCDRNQGSDCAKLDIVTPSGILNMDRYAYVSNRYEFYYEDVWMNVLYLVLFGIGFQGLTMVSARYVRHIVR